MSENRPDPDELLVKINQSEKKNVKGKLRELFIVSPANYQILMKQKSADSYLQFFKLHFQ